MYQINCISNVVFQWSLAIKLDPTSKIQEHIFLMTVKLECYCLILWELRLHDSIIFKLRKKLDF